MIETVIEPRAGIVRTIELKEVWRYRELLWVLSLKEIRVRYKQALLGVAWAVIQPLTTVLIFSVLFGYLAKLPSDGLPYPLFSFAALMPWVYFSTALARGSQSLVNQSSLISKVYFPRVLVPLSSILSALVDYAISIGLFLIVSFLYGHPPHWQWFIVCPLLSLLLLSFALGVSLWLSALNVRYRDVGHVIPFLLQIWMFVTPVVYPVSMVPERFRWLVALNPLAGVVDGFRSSLTGGAVSVQSVGFACGVTGVLLVTGSIYFAQTEKKFADII